MATTTPNSSAIDTSVNMEEKILSILSETYPNLDCGAGTPVYEMVVLPMALLWAKQAQGINELLASVNLANYTSLQENDMDRLVSRYFIERRSGAYVTGTVRVVFTEQADVSISADDVWEASDDRLYKVLSDHYYLSDELPQDSDTGYYYIDIAVQSMGKGSMYNADADTPVTLSGTIKTQAVKAYFVEATTSGGTIESNYNLYYRTKDELANKGLYSYKSVIATLRENFDTISEVVPIGLRDSEMTRDIINIRKHGLIHVGGKCDIYIRPDTFTVENGYHAPLGFPMSFQGHTLADDPDGLMMAWNNANLATPDATLRGSSQEKINLLTSETNMSSLTTDLTEIDNFVADGANELLHTDNLVKQKWPIVVRAHIILESSYSDAVDIATAKITLTQYINGLTASQAPSATEIIHLLRAAGLETIHLPITLHAYYLTEGNTDTSKIRIEKFGLEESDRDPANSVLVPASENKDDLSFTITDQSQMSLNTCCWYTNEDLIIIEVVS